MNSTQLDLELHDVRLRIPWNGTSPRSLTRAAQALFLKRERQKDERFFVDPEQVDLFRAAIKKAPWVYQGAPLLKALNRR